MTVTMVTMNVEEVFKLQKILCQRSDSALSTVLANSVSQYTSSRQNVAFSPSEDVTMVTATEDVRGFVGCCLDSLRLLAATLPTPPEFTLSVTDQNTLTQVTQMLFGFGVAALCDPGVCPVTMVTVSAVTKVTVERYETCPAQRNMDLQEIVLVLQPIVRDNYYGSLVLSRHVGILIAACIQVLYGPNNPSRVIKQNKCPLLVQKSRLVNTSLIKGFLDELLYKWAGVVPGIVSLQLPKGPAKPPTWLLAVTNDVMRLQVLRPQGLVNVTRALFEHYGNILAHEDQSFCDKVASVITSPPRVQPEEYITNVTEQVGVMLEELSNSKLRQQYLRLYKNLVHKLTVEYPEQSFTLVWCKVFEPCCTWNSNHGNHGNHGNQVLLGEKEAESWLHRLETVANLGLFHNNMADKLSSQFLLPLLFLYHHLHQSISPLRAAVHAILLELMSSSSVWVDILLGFLAVNVSERRCVRWGHGDTGGVLLKHSSPTQTTSLGTLSLDPNDILGGNDKIVEVIMKLLKSLPSDRNDELSDFFISLFRQLIGSVSEGMTLYGHHVSDPEKADNFLEGPVDLHHFQASLRKGLLLDQLCQAFGQKLLKNTAQTIELLKVIINQKSENPSLEKDELLLISFGILSTYLRDEIKLTETDEKEIKSLMSPLVRISDTSGNDEVAKLSNDLRICIATKINLDSLPSFGKETAASPHDKETLIADIMKDLGDPLIPSRAHAIIQLGKRLANKDPLVVEHVALLQRILFDNLTHDDSYIFLAAVRCLAQMCCYHGNTTQSILDRITLEIHNTSRQEDDRAKCMEVLVEVIKITGEMLPRYETQIFNCLLGCVTHQHSELMRVSSLSCLGELCRTCKYGILTHVQEILEICEVTLLEDESLLAKRGAVLLLANFIQHQDKTLFLELERETLRMYRLLKKVSATSSDEEVQHRALQALGVLSHVVREFMFPKTMVQHDIKIL